MRRALARLLERWAVPLIHILALLPVLALLRAVDLNAVDMPFMDDWQFVPLVERVRAGEIPWGDLWAPHDEHRLLVPRLLIIASVILSDGNYRVQCFVTVGTALVLSLSLLFVLRRTLGTGQLTPWVWGLANLILFSPIQWHNWLWPMQFCYFLPFTLLGLALAAFYSNLHVGWRFGLAQLCAWTASFSFIHGPLIWPAMLPLLLVDERWRSAQARRLFVAGWIAAGALASFLYLNGILSNSADPTYAYQHHGVPPGTSTLEMLRSEPVGTLWRLVQFSLAVYGSATGRGVPVSSNLYFAVFGGCLLLAAGLAFSVALWRRGRLTGPALAWIALGLHALGTASLVGLGRVFLGPGQPLTPRYTTFGSLFLLAVVMLGCLVFSDPETSRRARDRALLACGALLALVAVSWSYGLNFMGEWHDSRMAGRAAIHFSQRLPVPMLPALAGGRRGFLNKQIAALDRLGYWHPQLAASLRLDQFRVGAPLGDAEGRFYGTRATPKGLVEVRGLARFGSGGRTPDAVLLTSADREGTPTIRAICEVRSPPRWLRHATMRDYEFALRSSRGEYGAFSCDLRHDAIPEGESRKLEAWALDFGRFAVRRVRGTRSLPEAAPQP